MKKEGRFLLLVSFLGILLLAFTIAENSESTSSLEWRMMGRGLNQTGWDGNSFSTPLYSGASFYASASTSNPYGKAAIVNGFVYFPSMDSKLYQLNASNISQQIANFPAPQSISSSPAVVNNYVYFGSFDDKVYQVNATNVSQVINTFPTMGSVEASPAVYNGYVYIGSDDDKFYQLNASNISIMYASYTAGSDFGIGAPAIANGYAYIGSVDDKFYQLNASNVSQFIASYTTGGDILSSPSIYNGSAYIQSVDGLIYQLNASNVSQKFASFNVSLTMQYTNLAIANGYVYAGRNKIYQLNASNVSQQVANFTAGTAFISGPMFANRYIYVGNNDGKIYQLNASNVSNLVGSFQTGSTIYSSPSYASGYVYFGSWDGYFYQLNSSNFSADDLIYPNVTILSPTNQTYTSAVVSIDINLSEAGSCNYSLDNGVTNFSLTANAGGTEFTGTTSLSNGNYNLTAICSDLRFNMNTGTRVVFTIAAPPSSDSGSSGSGGGWDGYENEVHAGHYLLSDSDLLNGYTFYLDQDDTIAFVLDNENHTLTMNGFSTSMANITLQSSPQIFFLLSTEPVLVDLDYDRVADIVVRYDGLSDDKAILYVQKYENSDTSNNEVTQSPPSSESRTLRSVSPVLYLAVVLLVCAIAVTVVLKKRKMQSK